MPEVSPGSRSDKDATFREDLMKEGAGYATPLVCLALAIDDQIDRDIESSKLPTEPSLLFPAAREVRLDDQQVQVAVRPSLAPCTRPEKNDVGVGGGRSETAPDLLDQSIIGHGHGFRSVVAGCGSTAGRHLVDVVVAFRVPPTA
jgi:hypothetical protein